MARLFNRSTVRELAKMQVCKYAHKADHWSVIRKKKTHMDKALAHFDEFYANVYGKSWEDIRTALLQETHKYMAVVNSFSDIDRIKSELESHGAMNLKSIYETYKEHINAHRDKSKMKKKRKPAKKQQTDSVITDAQVSAIQSHYPIDCASLPVSPSTEKEDETEDKNKVKSGLQPVEMKSIDANLNEVMLDENRIVHPNAGLSGLYEFVPASKIKGMEDWILESQHYGYYKEGADFSINIEKEATLMFPQYLNIYTFEENNDSPFPSPKNGSTGVLDYYLLDGASVLPVLALDLQPGDVVLDMCAAPGGKTLSILQTLMPRTIVANDLSQSRVKRIHNVINQYVAGIGKWKDRLYVTERDARYIEDKDIYNKILVDVPCTTDRHVLHSEDNNIFKPQRIRERLQMPELQAAILTNALKIVAVGGTVVYSTCSLSPIQNDGVVGMALKKTWEDSNSIMVVKDMREALKPLRCLYKFHDFTLKHGHIVIPTLDNNWGPMYFCKIVRIR
ncbi:5-methylcytosine rRNA methyltransferase NSUN4 [Nylanderia fulva]|uniref:5-methylcytosine rRNA methyltransferase NSUN4 n=1 Tax=Nylanderia fulva TaxID=613905 RepID=UPI0010FB0C52|nr:5-methylcytosine rRNA methyltransferase NSUN4 [Nylanderia fulva]XP_029157752.1 5-methylcytosine rRNA methyltransferase NSUN4 [Nylanderia fulva]XP_029157753.1 5-methylcytosine rRNA methyltransferase NSUN4 [Nylanderia fulva]